MKTTCSHCGTLNELDKTEMRQLRGAVTDLLLQHNAGRMEDIEESVTGDIHLTLTCVHCDKMYSVYASAAELIGYEV